jgi:phosphoesterase RecJ-like protein
MHLVVDTSAWQQLLDVGEVLKKTSAEKVIIDHHLSSDDLGAMEFKDVSAAATGVLITELVEASGMDFHADQAACVFAAIATDTGWFRFSNVDARTFETAARLVGYGAQPDALFKQLYERSSLARLKLHSLVLARVVVDFEGRLAHTFVTLDDFRETKSHPSDTEDLVNSCLTIDGTQAAFILVEQQGGRVKASLRSRSELNVAAIAEQFGGGGHRQAAGAMLPGPVAAAQETLLKAFAETISRPE